MYQPTMFVLRPRAFLFLLQYNITAKTMMQTRTRNATAPPTMKPMGISSSDETKMVKKEKIGNLKCTICSPP